MLKPLWLAQNFELKFATLLCLATSDKPTQLLLKWLHEVQSSEQSERISSFCCAVAKEKNSWLLPHNLINPPLRGITHQRCWRLQRNMANRRGFRFSRTWTNCYVSAAKPFDNEPPMTLDFDANAALTCSNLRTEIHHFSVFGNQR